MLEKFLILAGPFSFPTNACIRSSTINSTSGKILPKNEHSNESKRTTSWVQLDRREWNTTNRKSIVCLKKLQWFSYKIQAKTWFNQEDSPGLAGISPSSIWTPFVVLETLSFWGFRGLSPWPTIRSTLAKTFCKHSPAMIASKSSIIHQNHFGLWQIDFFLFSFQKAYFIIFS